MELQLFTTQDGRPLDWEVFLNHPLGRIYTTIPFRDYEALINYRTSNKGPSSWFDLRGGIGLQILKHYYKCSDAKLLDQINHNKIMQYFCGINLKVGQQIKDQDIISRWRRILGHQLSIKRVMNDLQLANASHWLEDLVDKRINVSDATCYESYVRYPTDVKLLWESIDYLQGQIKIICKYIGLARPRSKYKELRDKYLTYQRSRKKSHQKTRRIKKSLLYLLNKFLEWMPGLISALKQEQAKRLQSCKLKANFYKRLNCIKKVYQQQQLHYDTPGTKIENRIISLAKPYLRPIVRGKETRRVEFGMKVHEMQINGINFIEHWNFEAFHEGNRMKSTLWKHQHLFKQKCKFFGGDQIYATNKNRKYCSQHQVQTCFRPKGRAVQDQLLAKQQKQLRNLIGKERATRLEGSFGNKKNHYLLDRIKARTYHTELAWIFFGNLTANAVLISKRRPPPCSTC